MIILTPQHLNITLRAICYGNQLPTTPLFRLKCVPHEMHDHISSDIAMTDWLTTLICTQLNRQREIYQLAPMSLHLGKTETQAAIHDVFQLDATRLQAWMLLYARVARTDLNLTMDELGKISNTHPRTLCRRQQLAVHCLYAHIIRLEINV